MGFLDLLKRAAATEKTAGIARPTPLRMLLEEDITPTNVEVLKVMVSSPLGGLENVRAKLDAVIDAWPGVKALLFEHQGTTGRDAVDTSTTLVKMADVVIILLGPNAGSTIAQTAATTFSQHEANAVRTCQTARSEHREPTGRPRVLVYTHKLNRELQDWEHQLKQRYGAYADPEDDEDALIAKITHDIATALLDERWQQSKALFALRAQRDDARQERQRIDVQSRNEAASHARELAAANNAAEIANKYLDTIREQAARDAEQLARDHDSRERRVLDAETRAISAEKGWVEDLQQARDAAARAGRRRLSAAVGGLLAGALLAAVPIAMYSSELQRAWSDAITVQRQGLSGLAAAVNGLGVHLPIPADPSAVAAKVRLAKALNSAFDCTYKDRHVWNVSINGKEVPSATFEKSDVCESVGAFLLRLNSRASNCQFPVIPKDVSDAIAATIAREQMAFRLIRIVGHASIDKIHANCGTVPPRLLAKVSDAPESLEFRDAKISTNTQLAWVRAADIEHGFEAAFAAIPTQDKPPVIVTAAMGVLDRVSEVSEAPNGLDRRVDIELFVTERPPNLVTAQQAVAADN